MRLWHEQLIQLLPRPQLLGQHRECCALRGNGWDKPHATVNYVFNYPPSYLFLYHKLIMEEMTRRGYSVTKEWYNPLYRGQKAASWEIGNFGELKEQLSPIYPEHDANYLKACLKNLEEKGMFLRLD